MRFSAEPSSIPGSPADSSSGSGNGAGNEPSSVHNNEDER